MTSQRHSGKGEEDLQCKSLFTIGQRRLGLPEDDETRVSFPTATYLRNHSAV